MQNHDRVSKGIADILEAKADCVVKAGENGVIQSALATKLRKLADLRNSLVHRYWIINDGELFNLCSANINDFSDFSSQVARK